MCDSETMPTKKHCGRTVRKRGSISSSGSGSGFARPPGYVHPIFQYRGFTIHFSLEDAHRHIRKQEKELDKPQLAPRKVPVPQKKIKKTTIRYEFDHEEKKWNQVKETTLVDPGSIAEEENKQRNSSTRIAGRPQSSAGVPSPCVVRRAYLRKLTSGSAMAPLSELPQNSQTPSVRSVRVGRLKTSDKPRRDRRKPLSSIHSDDVVFMTEAKLGNQVTLEDERVDINLEELSVDGSSFVMDPIDTSRTSARSSTGSRLSSMRSASSNSVTDDLSVADVKSSGRNSSVSSRATQSLGINDMGKLFKRVQASKESHRERKISGKKSVEQSEENEDDDGPVYPGVQYLYNVKYCKGVQDPATLLRERQRSHSAAGTIELCGNHRDDGRPQLNWVCPYCEVRPRKLIERWLCTLQNPAAKLYSPHEANAYTKSPKEKKPSAKLATIKEERKT